MKKLFFSVVVMMVSFATFAQVKISTGGGNPDPSSMLEVESSTKGFLPPRMTTSQRDVIQTPAKGLIIFNTDLDCLQFYLGNNSWYSICPSLAIISTNTPTNIGGFSATVGGSISSDGGANITSRGICWSTSPNPDTTDNVLLIGSGLGTYSNTLNGLNSNATYYVRAFAINSAGVSYGSDVSFTTLSSSPIIGGGYSVSGATFQARTSLGSDTPDKAFDGTLTPWHSAQYDKVPWNNPWVRVTLPSARIINRYRLWHRNSPTFEDRLNSWVFQGSNDGVNWVVLDTRNNATPPYPGTSTFASATYGDYSFTNSTPYLYYRIFGTAGNAGHEYTVIGEIQLWGF
jgi:hypothetical protein